MFPRDETFLKTCVDNGLQLEGVAEYVIASSAGPSSNLTQEAQLCTKSQDLFIRLPEKMQVDENKTVKK